MKEPRTMTEFQYSRIYAQGWNAARTGSTVAKTTARNPYPADPERARWQQGFTAALGHNEEQA